MNTTCFYLFFFSSRRRHTRCALVTGVQTCALPICWLWPQHHLAHHLAPFQHRKALAPVGQIERGVDMRPDAPLGRQRVDRRDILRSALGKATAIFARAHPDDRKALDKPQVPRKWGNAYRPETPDSQTKPAGGKK